MRQVAEELDLPASFRHRRRRDALHRSGAPHLDARAPDDQVGVYCAEMAGDHAPHGLCAHALKKDGRPPELNPMSNGTYASCFHSDKAMLEAQSLAARAH